MAPTRGRVAPQSEDCAAKSPTASATPAIPYACRRRVRKHSSTSIRSLRPLTRHEPATADVSKEVVRKQDGAESHLHTSLILLRGQCHGPSWQTCAYMPAPSRGGTPNAPQRRAGDVVRRKGAAKLPIGAATPPTCFGVGQGRPKISKT